MALYEDDPHILTKASRAVNEVNEVTAKEIGINPASRTTTIKPAGNSSCVAGSASGIHAWHAQYYIRNMQCKVGDDLYNFFKENYPFLIRVMDYDPMSAVIATPQMAPAGAILRDNETALELLERIKLFQIEWIRKGYRQGDNHNNVSATVSIKDFKDGNSEWKDVGEWM
jgi:ribonucleoside-diphosphate reductase alpha chain